MQISDVLWSVPHPTRFIVWKSNAPFEVRERVSLLSSDWSTQKLKILSPNLFAGSNYVITLD